MVHHRYNNMGAKVTISTDKASLEAANQVWEDKEG